MKLNHLLHGVAVLLLAALTLQPSTSLAQSSAFTYQGRLNDSGQPASGIYDLRFTIHDALSGGTVRGGPVNKPGTPVTNGLFTVALDFGAGAFDGADRWLEIAAGTNGASVLTPLAPRQPITATPYAVRAANFSGAVSDGQLSANVARLNSSPTFTGTITAGGFSGGGANLTGLNANNLATGTVPDARLGANVARLNANQAFTGTNLFSNRVGLGVAAPGTSLEVNGGLRVRGGSPGPFGTNNNGITFNGVGDTDSGISSSANGQLEFYSNSGETMRIQANGFVGIGTNNPQSALHVAGAVRADNFIGPVAASQLTGTLAPGTIANGSITTAMLAAGAVGSNQLASGAVTTSSLADGAVTALKMATTNGNRAALSITFNNPTPAGGDSFGYAVAAMGSDRVLIGAVYDDTGAAEAGAAYLFTTNGTLITTFNNPTPVSQDYFGYSVAAVGNDRVLIGATGDDTGAAGAGAAYLFSTNGTLLATFNNPTPETSDSFGVSVAAVGSDRVLIGAHGDNTGGADAGAAYLFSTNGTLLATFNNPNPAVGDLFGFSVAAVGIDRVLIGAYGDDTGAPDTGAAYLFNTNGTLITTFNSPTPKFREEFGHSVAAMGSDRVLIGGSGEMQYGSAYLFSTNGTLLTTFANPASRFGDGFGSGMTAVGSDRVLIGINRNAFLAYDAWAAYLFSTNGTFLTVFNDPAPADSDYFGASLAVVGNNRVLIGASGVGAGAAYLFSLDAFTPSLVAEGVRFGGITTASLADGAVTAQKLDPTIGLWTASVSNVYRADGNVGIGSTAPAGRLEIQGGANAGGYDDPIALALAYSSGGFRHFVRTRHSGTFAGNGIDFFLNTNSTAAGSSAPGTGNTLALSINTTGVGIGTASPAKTLQVGDINVRGSEGMIRLASRTPSGGSAARKWDVGVPQTGDNADGQGYSFVIRDADNTASEPPFLIRYDTHYVGIGTTNPQSALHVVGTVTATAFNPPSDRDLKENFAPVNPREVLDKVTALPISRWTFKGDAATPHVGPMAQDFHAAFGLGTDDKHIATVDADGVALAAIQGLNAKVEDRSQRLETENAELKQRLTQLEELVRKLAAQPNRGGR